MDLGSGSRLWVTRRYNLSTKKGTPTLINLHGEQGFSKRVDMIRNALKVLFFLAADMNGWLGERATRTRTL